MTVESSLDSRLQAVLRADVLALDVDVHERGQVVLAQDLAAQRGEAAHQVVEQLAHGLAARLDLARAPGLTPERRWDSHAAQWPTPAQNST